MSRKLRRTRRRRSFCSLIWLSAISLWPVFTKTGPSIFPEPRANTPAPWCSRQAMKVLRRYGQFEVLMGHSDPGLDALRRSVTLDPLNGRNYFLLGEGYVWSHRPKEALVAFDEAKALEPDDASVYGWIGYAYLTAHDYQSAKEACERTIEDNRFHCLAMAYDGLGRHGHAEAMLAKLTSSPMTTENQGIGVFLAMIYAQRGDVERALAELERALGERDPYLEYLKTNPFLDPLRSKPRFQAIERELNFPE